MNNGEYTIPMDPIGNTEMTNRSNRLTLEDQSTNVAEAT